MLDGLAGRATPADLVLLTGDNTDDGSADGYRRLREAVSSLGAPVLAVPGNHDDPLGVAATFGSADHAEVGSWRVVGVDSSRPAQVHGTVDVAAAIDRLVVSGHLHDAFELAGPGATALLGCPSTIMAIGHDGDRFEVGADAVTGGRVLTLHDDGSWSSELLVA